MSADWFKTEDLVISVLRGNEYSISPLLILPFSTTSIFSELDSVFTC